MGQNHTITIGDMSAKYLETGFSDLQWVGMSEDEVFGLLPKLSEVGIEDREEDNTDETPEELSAVLTLSSSYIGLP